VFSRLIYLNIVEEKRVEREKEPYITFRTFSNKQPEEGDDDFKKPLKNIVRRTRHPLVSPAEEKELADIIIPEAIPSMDMILLQTVRPREQPPEGELGKQSVKVPKKEVNVLADAMKRFGVDSYYPELKVLLNPEPVVDEAETKGKKKKDEKPKSRQPSKTPAKGKEEIRATTPPKTAVEPAETQISDQQCIDFILANLTPPVNKL
jgi:hypothetical protein